MRILAILFATSLFGACIDSDGTPVGVDDIEENTENDLSSGVLKDDGDLDLTPREPKARDVPTTDAELICGTHDLDCTPNTGLQNPGVRPTREIAVPARENVNRR